MQPTDLAALITAAAMLMYLVVSFNVGRARTKYQISPPQTHGPEPFERVYRVQMNTLEQLAYFLPSLWLFAFYMPYPLPLAILGGGWVVARILYAAGYYKDAPKRMPGFVIGILCATCLLLGAIFGLLRTLM